MIQSSDIARLIRSLPLNQPLQAQIFKTGVNDQLLLEFTRQLQINLPQSTQLPELPANQNEIKALLTILQKTPEIILKLNLPEPELSGKNNPSQNNLIRQNLSLKTAEATVGTAQKNANLILTLVRVSNNNYQLKLLSPDNNTSPAIKLLIENATNFSLPVSSVNIKNLTLNSQSTSRTSIIAQETANISTLRLNNTQVMAERLWPQHATVKNVPLIQIVKALTQLSAQLPVEKLPAEFKVIRSWLDRLIKTISQPPSRDINNNRPPFSQILSIDQIKNIISHSGTRFENNLRQLSVSESGGNQHQIKLGDDIKAQIIKILQAIPFIIDKYGTQPTLQAQLSDNELWQVIFKVQKILETMQPVPAKQMLEQPQLWTNWVEQTFKLLTVWLKTIELHQFQQMNPQPNQQSLLRFDIPIPLQQGTQWVNIEMQQHKKQGKKSRKWQWQLTLNFNFGEGKYLSAVTRVNKKQLEISFEGSVYFKEKMNPENIKILESRLKDKTELDTLISFHLNESGKLLTSSDGIHIEV